MLGGLPQPPTLCAGCRGRWAPHPSLGGPSSQEVGECLSFPPKAGVQSGVTQASAPHLVQRGLALSQGKKREAKQMLSAWGPRALPPKAVAGGWGLQSRR